MKITARKILILCLTFCMVTALAVPARAAEELLHNTVMDYAYVLDVDTLTQYHVGYSFGSNDKDNWGVALEQEEEGNGTLGRLYSACAKIGNMLSASVDCSTENVRLIIAFEAVDEDGNRIDYTEVSNESSGSDMIDCYFTVPEGTVDVAMLIAEFPLEGGYASKGTVAVMAEFLIDGKVTPGGSDGPVDPDVPDAPVKPDKPSKKTSSFTAVLGAGAVIALFAALKSRKPGKSSGGKSGAGEDTYVLKDNATGAETLYVKDGATGEWVSSDGSTVLDADKVPEWQQQRDADRAWQDEANKGTARPTVFADIDAEQARMEEQISRETYLEKVAISHGMDAEDMDAVYEKVAHDQAAAEVSADKWNELAEKNDTGLKIAENLKTTADYSVSALGAVTGPAGTVIKDLYTAGTTVGGDVSEAIAEGKDGYEVAQTLAGAVVKTSVGVIQNHATGVAGKAAADIAGGGVSGGIDAYVQGKDVAQGTAIGVVGGTFSAMVDTGLEMAGALKDSGMADGLLKDLAGAATDANGDLVKNALNDAVTESFEKTFNDLKPKAD